MSFLVHGFAWSGLARPTRLALVAMASAGRVWRGEPLRWGRGPLREEALYLHASRPANSRRARDGSPFERLPTLSTDRSSLNLLCEEPRFYRVILSRRSAEHHHDDAKSLGQHTFQPVRHLL